MGIVCDKVGYRDRKDAKEHIRGLIIKTGNSYTDYKCDICGKVHISTISKKRMNKLNEKNYVPIPYNGGIKVYENISPTIGRSVVKKEIVTTYKPFEHLNKEK